MMDLSRKVGRRRKRTDQAVITEAVGTLAREAGYTARRLSSRAAVVLDRMRTYAEQGDGRCARTVKALGQPLEHEDGPLYAAQTVQHALKELRDCGLIKPVGTAPDRATIYELHELAHTSAQAGEDDAR